MRIRRFSESGRWLAIAFLLAEPIALASEPCAVLNDAACRFVGRIQSIPVQSSSRTREREKKDGAPKDPVKPLKDQVNAIHGEIAALVAKLSDPNADYPVTETRISNLLENKKALLEQILERSSAARERFEESSIYEARTFHVGIRPSGNIAAHGMDESGWPCSHDGVEIDKRDADEVIQKLKFIPGADGKYKRHVEAIVAAYDPRLRDEYQIRKYGLPQFLPLSCEFLWELDGINSEVSLRREESEHNVQLYGPMNEPKSVLGLFKRALVEFQGGVDPLRSPAAAPAR